MSKRVILVAGGTGGHINAAISLAEEFKSNDYEVLFFTGKRHLDYQLLSTENTIHIDAKPLRVKGLFKFIINALLNFKSFFYLYIKIIIYSPKLIIGCGGYVCGPVLLSGWLSFKKIFVVEQNAIAGVTNKLLAKISDKNFINYAKTIGIEKNKIITGNPIRSNIKFEKIEKPGNNINILIFGGSLGATQINKAVKPLLDKLDKKFKIRHQVGKGNINNLEYENYEQFEFLNNIQKDYKWANIIISRAGASTVSELEVIQKPSILIPYPAAVDNHQFFNAKGLKDKVEFEVQIIDSTLESEELASELFKSINFIDEKELYRPLKIKEPQKASKIIYEETIKLCLD